VFAGYDIAHELAASSGARRISASDGADGAHGSFSDCSLFGLVIRMAGAALREAVGAHAVQ
jgi:hypothetical protein